MVQEFYLAMVTIALLLNVAWFRDGIRPGTILIQLFGVAFLWVLWLHLRNTNQDRIAALQRKREIEKSLGFQPLHQNVSGLSRVTAPRQMVSLTFAAATARTIWTMLPFVYRL
jgi:hypothetical protein